MELSEGSFIPIVLVSTLYLFLYSLTLFKASKLQLHEIVIDPEDNIVVAGSIHGWCIWDSYNVSSNDLHGVVVWMDSEGSVTHFRVFPTPTDFIEFWSIAMDNYVIISQLRVSMTLHRTGVFMWVLDSTETLPLMVSLLPFSKRNEIVLLF
jgi:hypothetical protein